MNYRLEYVIKCAMSDTNVSRRNIKLYHDMIYALVNDLKILTNSNEISYLKPGHRAYAIRVGDYVLTIGKMDEYEVKPNPKFSNAILCIIRYPDENFEMMVSLYLSPAKKINEAQEIYNNIRDTHHIWYDIKMNNFGIVPKDFVHPFNEASAAGLKMLGIDNCFIENLKAGEIRLIDHGYILHENVDPIFRYDYRLLAYLENRYVKTKRR